MDTPPRRRKALELDVTNVSSDTERDAGGNDDDSDDGNKSEEEEEEDLNQDSSLLKPILGLSRTSLYTNVPPSPKRSKSEPPWLALSEDLFVTKQFVKSMAVSILHDFKPKNREFNTQDVRLFLKHSFASDSFQNFVLQDVMHFQRDNSVLLISADVTLSIAGFTAPKPPRRESGFSVTEVAEYIEELKRQKNQIQYYIRTNSDWEISPEMFPIRETTCFFPYRAIAFMVPPNFGSSGGHINKKIPGEEHYSILIYYVHEPVIQDTYVFPDKKENLDGTIFLKRLYTSRPVSENETRLWDEHNKYRILPNIYHYDSSFTQLNRDLALRLTHNLAKIGFIFDSTGDINFISALKSKGQNPELRVGNTYLSLETERQLQASCASWSIAYPEKVEDSCIASNFSPLDRTTLLRMNEVCSTDIARKALDKLEKTGTFYERLLHGPIPNSGGHEAEIEQILRKKIVHHGNQIQERRIESLAQFMASVYCNFKVKDNARKSSFIAQDNVNIHPDFIKLYLLLDFACSDDILFSTDLVTLGSEWLACQDAFFSRAKDEKTNGKTVDQATTPRYFSRHVNKIRKIPKLVIWLQLPEYNAPPNAYPMLIVFRPLYQSTLAKQANIRLNTLFIYSGSPMEEKRADITNFYAIIRAWEPFIGEFGRVPPSLNGTLYFHLREAFGRYFIIDLLKHIVREDCSVPDTEFRITEYYTKLEKLAEGDVKDFDTAWDIIPHGEARYPKGERIKMSLSDSIKRMMYGRNLHFLAGQETLASNNLDQGSCWKFSKVLIRDNDDDLVETTKRQFTRSRVFTKPPTPEVGGEAKLFSFKSNWISRTRLRWASWYFNYTFRAALEAAIYQITRGKDPVLMAKIASPEISEETKEKIGRRVVQSCPCALRIYTNVTTSPSEPREIPLVLSDWAKIAGAGLNQFLRMRTSSTTTTTTTTSAINNNIGWFERLPNGIIEKVPVTEADYQKIPIVPLAKFSSRFPKAGGEPSQLTWNGIYQFPVIIHGSSLGMNDPPVTVLDIWDILALTLDNRFWTMSGQHIARRDRISIIDDCMDNDDMDPSCRITHHDPYLHIKLRNYQPDTSKRIRESLEEIRATIFKYQSLNLDVLCTKPLISELMNFSYADVCMIAVKLIQQILLKKL